MPRSSSSALGGIAVGVVVALLVTASWRRTADPIARDRRVPPRAGHRVPRRPSRSGRRGVLATVTAGLIAGRTRLAGRCRRRHASSVAGSGTSVIFLINGFVFMLIGLQLPAIAEGLSDGRTAEALGIALVVSLDRGRDPDRVGLPRHVPAAPPVPEPAGARPVPAVAGGVRRLVGRACAASSRLRRPWRSPRDFPERDLIIFITFVVILVTLVGQGLTLPWLIRALGVTSVRRVERRGGNRANQGDRGRPRPACRARAAVPGSRAARPRAAGALRPPRLATSGSTRMRARDEDGAGAARAPADPAAVVLDAERDAVIRLRDDGRDRRRGPAHARARPRSRGAPDGGVRPRRAAGAGQAAWYPRLPKSEAQ